MTGADTGRHAPELGALVIAGDGSGIEIVTRIRYEESIRIQGTETVLVLTTTSEEFNQSI